MDSGPPGAGMDTPELNTAGLWLSRSLIYRVLYRILRICGQNGTPDYLKRKPLYPLKGSGLATNPLGLYIKDSFTFIHNLVFSLDQKSFRILQKNPLALLYADFLSEKIWGSFSPTNSPLAANETSLEKI